MQLNDKNTHDILPIQVVITSKSFKNQIYDNDWDGKDVWLKGYHYFTSTGILLL